ncbi:MAG: GspH/FimT family pseudopilin [Rhodanobacteraceae bacterium]
MGDQINKVSMHRCDAARGFGLIELVITIAVAAILTAIALPSFTATMRSNRVASQANDLVTALNFARNEAVTRTQGVSVCAADTHAGLPTTCGAATDWDQGWVAFIDNTVGVAAPTAIDPALVLRSWAANSQVDVTVGTQFVRFNTRGESVARGDAADGSATFTLDPSGGCTGQQERSVTVAGLGSVNSIRKDCP